MSDMFDLRMRIQTLEIELKATRQAYQTAVGHAESLKYSMHGIQDNRDHYQDLYSKEAAKVQRLEARLRDLCPEDLEEL